MPDGGEVRQGTAHADERGRSLSPVEPSEIGRNPMERLRDLLVRDDAVEAEALGVPRGADVDAEALLHPPGAAEGELAAAAAGIEDDERPCAHVERGRGSEVREPRLLLAGDDLDADAAAVPHGLDELSRVPGEPHSGGRNSRDLGCALAPGLLDHADDCIRGPSQRLRLKRPGVLQPLAEPRDLGPVGHRLPAAVRTSFADMELDRVRADVDHGEAHGLEAQHCLQPSCEADVRPLGEPQLAYGGGDELGSSASTAIVRADRVPAVTSDSSAMQSSSR